MERNSASDSVMWMLGGFALGVITMYLLDPDGGNRRRAQIRDKAYSAAANTRKTIDAQSRDLANRMKGWGAEMTSAVRH